MYRFSPDDYREISKVWNRPHPEDGSEQIVEETIPEGFTPPDLAEQPQLTAPGVDMAMLKEMMSFKENGKKFHLG